MLNKVAGLARALAILLALVAGFAPAVLASANVGLILVVLGLVAGLTYGDDDWVRTVLLVLALPIAGGALAMIPAVGAQLQAVTGGLALAVAGVLATRVIMRTYSTLVGDLKGLAG